MSQSFKANRKAAYLLPLVMLASLVLPGVSIAQVTGTVELAEDNVGRDNIIDLSEVLWRYHPGDDSTWADPDLDDSEWILLAPDFDVRSLDQESWPGIGWFRLHVFVDSTLQNRSLALSVDHLGASEVYLDGKLLRRFGTVSQDRSSERTRYPLLQPTGIHPNGRREHVIAIRYSFHDGARFVKRFGDLVGMRAGLNVYLAPLDAQIGRYVNSLNTIIVIYGVFFGITALISALHLLLFAFFDRDRSNLYVSLATACISVVLLMDTIPAFVTFDADMLALKVLTFLVFATSAILMLLVVVYSLFHPRLPRRLWGYAAAGALAIVTTLTWSNKWIILGYWILVFIESLRVVGQATLRRRDGAWIIGAGVLVLAVSVVIAELATGPSRSTNLEVTLLGFARAFGIYMSMPLALSVFLARRFARTNRQLEAQIRQSRRLSEQALTQEQEKQRLIAQQNEFLEREVAERTNELEEKNRILQTTMDRLRGAQEQLLLKEKMASLGHLTAGIAHELKNPLNFVNNFATLSIELAQELADELQANESKTVAEVRESFEEVLSDLQANASKISEHGRRADKIVRSMLLHSRSTTDAHRRANVNTLIDEYITLSYEGHRARTPDFNTHVERRFDPAAGDMEILPQELGRVILNLLDNAFFAVRARAATSAPTYRPIVSVQTRHIGDGMEINVSDNGNGIPESIRTRIFDPFFTTKEAGEGTGLGLSIAYEVITHGHGGRLEVESTEGIGTTFTIFLPDHHPVDGHQRLTTLSHS